MGVFLPGGDEVICKYGVDIVLDYVHILFFFIYSNVGEF